MHSFVRTVLMTTFLLLIHDTMDVVVYSRVSSRHQTNTINCTKSVASTALRSKTRIHSKPLAQVKALSNQTKALQFGLTVNQKYKVVVEVSRVVLQFITSSRLRPYTRNEVQTHQKRPKGSVPNDVITSFSHIPFASLKQNTIPP